MRTATIKQLTDALVARAAGKPVSEIAQIVAEVTDRLNALKRVKLQSGGVFGRKREQEHSARRRSDAD
jgi:hypothetical protein